MRTDSMVLPLWLRQPYTSPMIQLATVPGTAFGVDWVFRNNLLR